MGETDFQSVALPVELPGRERTGIAQAGRATQERRNAELGAATGVSLLSVLGLAMIIGGLLVCNHQDQRTMRDCIGAGRAPLECRAAMRSNP